MEPTESSFYSSQLLTMIPLLYHRILDWEKKYILKSPSVGKITFLNFWSKDQYVSAGERIFSVISVHSGSILGRCYLNTSGLGKVREVQLVIIKLNEYTYMEFGMLKGVVSTIFLIGIEDNRQEEQNRYAVVEIGFDTGNLQSTYSRVLEFRGELTGIAEIATKEMSLLEHLINPLKYLWSTIEH